MILLTESHEAFHGGCAAYRGVVEDTSTWDYCPSWSICASILLKCAIAFSWVDIGPGARVCDCRRYRSPCINLFCDIKLTKDLSMLYYVVSSWVCHCHTAIVRARATDILWTTTTLYPKV